MIYQTHSDKLHADALNSDIEKRPRPGIFRVIAISNSKKITEDFADRMEAIESAKLLENNYILVIVTNHLLGTEWISG